MRLFNCNLNRKTTILPKSTNVEIISSGIPTQKQLREAVERKYDIKISDNDISISNWERKEVK